jgi:hypothetical protein
MSSGAGGLLGGAVAPGGVFAVGGVAGQAAVEDADEAVAEGAQGLVVGIAGGGGTATSTHAQSTGVPVDGTWPD